jgi:hypothetical protein
MSVTPIFRRLKQNGTSFYAFPGAAEDISAQYQNDNYKMYFSKYVLLNFPKQQTNFGGTQAVPSYFDFGTFSTIAPIASLSYSERIIESLRNYVANHEVVLRESRLNNTEYYYDTRALETTTEKIFWKWCKKLNLVDFEPAIPSDEYFSNLEEFQRVDLTDDSYFPEYLWKEKEPIEINVTNYDTNTTTFVGYLQLELNQITSITKGDVIELYNFSDSGPLTSDIWNGSPTWLGTASISVLDVFEITGVQYVVVDFIYSGGPFTETSGKIKVIYNKLIQYIGEVTGVSNVQEANRAYTEVYAHVPDHTGQTPDILFRTIADVNYKPGLIFPIIPSQYQPEIIGAELFSSPIVSNPTEYPGSYYGQFDTIDFTYECESGDTLRRSGRYYGVSGDINAPVIDGSSLDGLTIDFNTTHYAKMNINDREVVTFDEFNALEINNMPPTDFEFNAILWYYTVEDTNGNRRTNIYGISFLDNPDNNPKPDEVGIKFPIYKKLVTNGNQDGTSYAFGLNLNFNIIHDNPQEAYNPEAINSLFSMNLFNEAMRRLGNINESFSNILAQQTDLQTELLDIKQLLYSQTDLNTINSRISNLDVLLRSYASMQLISSDTIQVETLDTSPAQLRLNSIDAIYSKIEQFNTTDMYDVNGAIPINVAPTTNKDFLIYIINNDDVNLTLPNSDKLSLLITEDLSYKQTANILISGSNLSTQNKKLDILITTTNILTISTQSLGGNIVPNDQTTTPPIETLLIGDIDLPIFYNTSTTQPNSASTWKGFNFDIDFNSDIKLLAGNVLQFKLNSNNLLVSNSVKVGDSLVLNNLFVGTVSTFDFSGQYKVDSVNGATVSLDVSNNLNFVAYASNTYPLVIHEPLTSTSILSNSPYLSLNKGYFIRVTRVSESDDVSLSEKYFVDVRELQY